MRKRKTDKKKILIAAGVIGGIALLFTSMVLFSKPKNSDESLATSSQEVEAEIKEPKYSVDITRVSDVNTRPYTANYQVTLTNISVEPYITNFAFHKCQLEDEDSSTYEVMLINNETTFDQAIMPGKSRSIELNADSLILSFTNSGNSLEKCEYGADGVNRCKTLSTLKVQSCTAYITTDGSQIFKDLGDYPLEVTFPRSIK